MEWNIENSYNSLTFRNWSNFESKYPICSCIDSKQKKKEKKKKKKKTTNKPDFSHTQWKDFFGLGEKFNCLCKEHLPNLSVTECDTRSIFKRS